MENKVIKKKRNIQDMVIYIGLVALIIIFAVLCAINGKAYLTWNNISNIIVQSSIIAIAAIGASVVILTGGIDLSTGAIIGFSGMVAALFMKAGCPLVVGVLLGILAGTLVGFINGIGISLGKLPAFIMTLATMQIGQGLTLVLCGGKPVQNFSATIGALSSTKIVGIPIFVFYVIIAYVIMVYIMSRTRFGRHIYALGGNAKAARLTGIDTKKLEISVYVISGLFASIAGIMLLARLCYGAPTSGDGYEMDCIAAAVIGGFALSGGKGKLINTLVGAFIFTILKNGLQLLDVQTYYQQIATGVIIAVCVFFDKAKDRKAE